jgi:hypothetical protein
MVLGQVTEATSHSVTLKTSKSEQMEFEFDSGTLMPTTAQLTPGTPVKVLFRTLDSGLHLAKRITALEPGSLDYQRLETELAMYESQRNAELNAARMQQRTDEAVAANAAATDESNRAQPSATERRESASNETRQTVDETAGAQATESRGAEELPRTASHQGWLLPVGIGAILVAVAARFARRRATV